MLQTAFFFWLLLVVTAGSNPCKQPILFGLGPYKIPRWGFDGQTCRLFYFRGCCSTANSFQSLEHCLRRCQGPHPCPGADIRQKWIPCSSAPCPYGFWCHQGATGRNTVCCPGEVENFCMLPSNVGAGNGDLLRYYYDSELRLCIGFVYGGLRGNANNFRSLAQCQQTCPAPPFPCTEGRRPFFNDYGRILRCNPLSRSSTCPAGYWCHVGAVTDSIMCCPFVNGASPCEMEVLEGTGTYVLPRYFFNSASQQCEVFNYTGLQGNANNFLSLQACREACPETRQSTRMTRSTQGNSSPRGPCPCELGKTTSPSPGTTLPLIPCPSCRLTSTALPTEPLTSTLPSTQPETLVPNRTTTSPTMQPTPTDSTTQSTTLQLIPCPTCTDPSTTTSTTERTTLAPIPCPLCQNRTTESSASSSSESSTAATQLPAIPCKPGTAVVEPSSTPESIVLPNRQDEVIEDLDFINPCADGQFAIRADGQPVRCSEGHPNCPVNFWCHFVGVSTDSDACCAGASTSRCDLPLAPGSGSANVTRYHFDSDSQECKEFFYTGVFGNQNNFRTREACLAACRQ